MTQRDNSKEACLERLRAWERELQTNHYGMKKHSVQRMRVLRAGIERKWPGTLNKEYACHECGYERLFPTDQCPVCVGKLKPPYNACIAAVRD